MTVLHRVLDETPCTDLRAYIAAGGGLGLAGAREAGPGDVIATLEASGLRGRGGAGFPTALKWRSILENSSTTMPTAVVMNGAEGEPSTFKDRTIIRNNPYRVIEGALVACSVVGASELVICMKRSFSTEWDRVTTAVAECVDSGWFDSLKVRFVAGPDAYLFGEETALLEVAEQRQPFPRVTPPWRRGLDSDRDDDGTPALAELASPVDAAGSGAPALVNNVETFANVALIMRHGAPWFREVGTADSPGTIVCTVVGDVRRHGVAEFAMGTPLRSVIDELGGGALPDRRVIAVLPGASSAVIGESKLDTALTHEAMRAAGTALGSAGFRCLDDQADLFALTHGTARFLAVESCGQCSPCKEDGVAITTLLASLLDGTAPPDVERVIADHLSTVTNEARCSLATQEQIVVGSLVAMCATAAMPARVDPEATFALSDLNALLPLVDIVDGVALYDSDHLGKQPDWSHEPTDTGSFPAQRLQGTPVDTDLSGP